MGVEDVLLLSSLMVIVMSNDYCSLTSQHTMCRHKGLATWCQATRQGLSAEEQQTVLDQHNRMRSKVASGQTAQPNASNMLELEWDKELAAVAQRHADQCQFEHDCNDCRRVARFRVGQNIYIYTGTSSDTADWKDPMTAWFDREIAGFPASSVTKYSFSHVTGHYSQIAWAATTRVGCGYTAFAVETGVSRLYVCNYGRAGNTADRPMYSMGRGCSQCPPDYPSCSHTYPGLCSKSSPPAGKTFDEKATEGKATTSSGKLANGKFGQGKSSNGKYAGGKSFEGKPVTNKESAEEKPALGKLANGKLRAGQFPAENLAKGKFVVGKSSTGASAIGKSPAKAVGKSVKGNSMPVKISEKNQAGGKSSKEEKSAKGKTANGKSAKGSSENGKSANEKSANGKYDDVKSPIVKSVDERPLTGKSRMNSPAGKPRDGKSSESKFQGDKSTEKVSGTPGEGKSEERNEKESRPRDEDAHRNDQQGMNMKRRRGQPDKGRLAGGKNLRGKWKRRKFPRGKHGKFIQGKMFPL